MTERDKFETWYISHGAQYGLTFTKEEMLSMREGTHYGCHRGYLNGLWAGWQARAAL